MKEAKKNLRYNKNTLKIYIQYNRIFTLIICKQMYAII